MHDGHYVFRQITSVLSRHILQQCVGDGELLVPLRQVIDDFLPDSVHILFGPLEDQFPANGLSLFARRGLEQLGMGQYISAHARYHGPSSRSFSTVASRSLKSSITESAAFIAGCIRSDGEMGFNVTNFAVGSDPNPLI